VGRIRAWTSHQRATADRSRRPQRIVHASSPERTAPARHGRLLAAMPHSRLTRRTPGVILPPGEFVGEITLCHPFVAPSLLLLAPRRLPHINRLFAQPGSEIASRPAFGVHTCHPQLGLKPAALSPLRSASPNPGVRRPASSPAPASSGASGATDLEVDDPVIRHGQVCAEFPGTGDAWRARL